ncbi:hypothetical protein C900_04901 [Fulvivirga imtechensis AK7]|uniref:Asparagine synthetase B n=1 Tax=Fulvivirga imtechensis AK7 TaxID=1237149 RepID=L8JL66_9BACT|nr:DUF2911 domain-containing protein [Fulvivirga imtechensis]ELR69676.1 hypothetical protein C900_04901 [Fulvivirga imtechensis AK7]
MKKYPIISLALIMTFCLSYDAFAQKEMKSPPATAQGSINGADIVIKYHQPSARGRTIMGELVPYGKVWRTGANNATTIELSKDVKVEGQSLKKGKYALFTIPGEDEWVVIFNKTDNQWGAFNYDEDQDVLRVTVKPQKTGSYVETFTINVEGEGVVLDWENTRIKFKVSE